MRVERYDLNAPISKVTQTPSGGIRVDGAVTRSGVFVYLLGDGTTRREYRPPEDVFAEDSLASLRGAPVTVMHPAEPVTSATWKRDAVGHLGDDVHTDAGRYVVAGVLVQDAAAVARIPLNRDPAPDDLIELSCGYSCGLEMTPGTSPEGEAYDAIQRGILYNHVALLPKGDARGGPEIRLRLDAGRCIVPTMRTHKIDGIEHEAGSDSHLAAVDKMIGTTLARAIAAEKRADAAEALAKDLAAKSSPEAIRAAARARAGLLAEAARRGVTDKIDDTTGDDAIIMAILKKSMPGVDFGKLMLSHEQLMAFLGQVVGATPAAPAEGETSAPGTEGAPPVTPGAGGMPADSIHAARDASDGKPPRNEDAELAARRDAAEKKLRAWPRPAR